MEKEYDINDKVYFVQWDNIAGLYTYEELKKEYGKTNLFDKPLNISFFSGDIELDTFDKVIEFLNNDDEIYLRHFIADNMRICRIY